MKKVLLIDTDAVRREGYVHADVLPGVIDITIRRCQDLMLRKVMGDKEYYSLLDKVSASLPPTDPIQPLDNDTKELIEEYIQPYLVACVDYKIVLPLTHRSRSKSVGKGVDENHTPSDISELIKLRDQYKSDVDSYSEILKEKLESLSCSNSEILENYTPTKKTPVTNIKFR